VLLVDMLVGFFVLANAYFSSLDRHPET
jgi:hypothetical protein